MYLQSIDCVAVFSGVNYYAFSFVNTTMLYGILESKQGLTKSLSNFERVFVLLSHEAVQRKDRITGCGSSVNRRGICRRGQGLSTATVPLPLPPCSNLCPAPSYRPAPSYQQAPAKYDFEWGVRDSYSANHFGHNEDRDGYNTQGSYYVQLPDGRLQKVTYYVNGDSGYVAEVSYEGQAQYPAYHAAPSYSPAPTYTPAPVYG
nr:cuticle protein 7-like [Penaeus vannamei]